MLSLHFAKIDCRKTRFCVLSFLGLANTMQRCTSSVVDGRIFRGNVGSRQHSADRCTNQLQLHCKYIHQHIGVDWWCPRCVSRAQSIFSKKSKKCAKMWSQDILFGSFWSDLKIRCLKPRENPFLTGKFTWAANFAA